MDSMDMFNVFDNLETLFFIGAALVSLIGLTRLIYLWNTGRHYDIHREIYLWIGGILLFLVSAAVSKQLFY